MVLSSSFYQLTSRVCCPTTAVTFAGSFRPDLQARGVWRSFFLFLLTSFHHKAWHDSSENHRQNQLLFMGRRPNSAKITNNWCDCVKAKGLADRCDFLWSIQKASIPSNGNHSRKVLAWSRRSNRQSESCTIMVAASPVKVCQRNGKKANTLCPSLDLVGQKI